VKILELEISAQNAGAELRILQMSFHSLGSDAPSACCGFIMVE